ncbi:MAG: pilus (MSHA type) biogenesis protein MshL [Magnetococcales bacterium]|nr:pilus (MSHA type) biogenesis protein MshL [Magnetococcales bacterium]
MKPIRPRGRPMQPKTRKFGRRSALFLGAVLGGVLIASCQTTDIKASKSHFLRPTDPPAHITAGADLPPDVIAQKDGVDPGTREEVYTITVTEMPVRDLLFALARDANKNIDVYPGISGRVTLSAIDQTLPQILDRVSKQVGIRYEIDGETVIVSPDKAYLKIYQVDYINVERDAKSGNKVSSQVSTGETNSANKGTTNLTSSDTSSNDANQSMTHLTTSSSSRFWRTLTQNIQSILGSEARVSMVDSGTSATSGGGTSVGLGDKMGKSGSSSGPIPGVIPAAGAGDILGGIVPPTGGGLDTNVSSGSEPPGTVSINPEAGIISVFASSAQHDRIQKYLDTVLDNVHRQVLIESTVVEVELNDDFREGVDWNQVFSHTSGVTFTGAFSKMNPVDSPMDFFTINHNTGQGSNGPIGVALKALESFGNTKVLSSPKIMALNNQAALLKVVRNEVFFTLESTATATTNNGTTTTTGTAAAATAQVPVFNTRVNTVPVGLIMSVTPQISDQDIVNLNVRPTISRIYAWKNDPNPALQRNTTTTGLEAPVISQIPEIEVKEMETMMRVHSGQVAVMGGLMQDETKELTNGLPVLGRLPGVGFLFSNQEHQAKKTELVIFLRPVVMTQGKPREMKPQQAKNAQKMVHATAQPVRKANQQPGAGKDGSQPGQPGKDMGQPAKDNPVPEKKETPEKGGRKGNELVPTEPAVKNQEIPSPSAMAPGGSYLDFTMPGGVGSLGTNGGNPAPTGGLPADVGQSAANTIAPTPARPALPPEEQEDPSMPMDNADRQAYDRQPALNQLSQLPPGFTRSPGPGRGNNHAAVGRGDVFLELGSYRQKALADNVQSQISAMGLPITREQAIVAGTPYQRVRSGPYGSQKEANQARDRIASLTGIQARLASQ